MQNILITLEEVYNEDIKISLAHDQKPIPKGTEVEYVGSLSNFYGYWWKVKYNDSYYYADPTCFKKMSKGNVK